jgi:hypothetical protein
MSKYDTTLPLYDRMVENNYTSTNWFPWFTTLHRNIQHLNTLPNNHLVLNPDFHWSRTKGNTPTVADGEFVEEWDVRSNGMTFSITPTFYTSTQPSSLTGSQRYVNVDITAVNSNEFEIYQQIANKISKFQNKKITFTALIDNKETFSFKIKFYVGFDTNDDGTDDVTAISKAVHINPGVQEVMVLVETPKITADNQANKINLKLLCFDLTSPIEFDLFFIKPEFSVITTNLLVDHTLEKVLIDNT